MMTDWTVYVTLRIVDHVIMLNHIISYLGYTLNVNTWHLPMV